MQTNLSKHRALFHIRVHNLLYGSYNSILHLPIFTENRTCSITLLRLCYKGFYQWQSLNKTCLALSTITNQQLLSRIAKNYFPIDNLVLHCYRQLFEHFIFSLSITTTQYSLSDMLNNVFFNLTSKVVEFSQ